MRQACKRTRKAPLSILGTNISCSIKDINENCLAEFRTHWQCLENHNQQLWNCRSEERKMNKCVFEKLVRSPNIVMCAVTHNVPEIGEDDTRCAQGRYTRSPTNTQYFCDSLSFVYIPPGQKNPQFQLKRFSRFPERCLLKVTIRLVC